MTTPTTAPHSNAPQPTAFANAPITAAASQALAIAATAREVAVGAAIALREEFDETCKPDAGAVSRCPVCGNPAPEGARCGICGACHGGR